MSTWPPVAWLLGEDLWGIDRAVREMAAALGGDDGPLAIWRTPTDDDGGDDGSAPAGRRRERLLGEIEQRLATAPLFGGGTLVVVRQPEAVVRATADRARIVALIGAVPPGNGLCFTELLAAGGKPPATPEPAREAVRSAGGLVREFAVPTRDRMEGWIAARGRELGIDLGTGAARLLAERIGAFVRESDIDRRRQTELADQELAKLALYRPDAVVTREDVAELVAEAVPGSAWAFLDAVGGRRAADAAYLAERLLADGTPPPVLISQLHRRLRELIVVREHLDAGVRGAALVREMRLQPFRAQKLEEQARRWLAADRLVGALDGLLELDLASKGIALDGSTRQMSDARTALALQAWIADAVAAGGTAGPSGRR